ncbi:MAG TPA: CDP-diacylglycerol--serine O-phosphatidyltransferase [Rhizobiales bacterium]|jgi:CDP-diacylglycerol--serine O-phosphatidyltransferase|nr:CDP-diacylglycerol--serine O-phosphatidyltransferase [Hyphomicrobiales bacterium]
MFPPFDPERDDRKRRQFVFARGQVPVRVLIPNIFTLVGLCAGLTAIRMAIESRWDLAVAALVFAAFLDGIDGRLARLLKASSRFGAELDSLADFVNFGVAPAIIMFSWALEDLHSLGWVAVLVFAVCSALRLARFNVSLDRTDLPAWKGNYFVGVPAPAGALILLLPIYVQDLGLHLPSLTPLVLFYTLGIALLMVSNVPTFSGKLIGQKIAREYVPPIFVLAALFVAMLLTYPSLTLAVGSLAYLAVIPVSAYRYLAEERKAAQAAKAQNGKGRAPGDHPKGAPQPGAGTTPGAEP